MAMRIPAQRRYRRRIGAFSAIDFKHDESVIDFSTAARCYNFDFTSGALRDGYGIRAHAAVPSSATRYWVYRFYSEQAGGYVDQYMYQLYNGLIRLYDSFQQKTLFISNTKFAPISALNYRLNGEDVLLMSCEGHKLLTWNGKDLVEHEGSPTISSMALHYERLFVTSRDEPTKVFFSDDLDPTNWTVGEGGGFIELLDERGELNKVVSFANYLYIFREHGISRVTAFADLNEFAVVNLFVAAGRIYPESITKCGSVIVFLASDGLYVFDGYDCARVLVGLDGLIVGGATSSAYYNGKYYLACKMDFADGETVGSESEEDAQANALLVFDPNIGEYSISRGLDLRFLSSCTYLGEDLLMAFDGSGGAGVIEQCGKRFDSSLPKRWVSPLSDFGTPDKTKSVRELYVSSATDFTLAIDNGKTAKTVAVREGSRRIRVNASGRSVSLRIDCDGEGCNVRPPTIIYTV